MNRDRHAELGENGKQRKQGTLPLFLGLRWHTCPEEIGVYGTCARIDDLTTFVPSPLYVLQLENTPLRALDGVEGLSGLRRLLLHGALLGYDGALEPLEDRPELTSLAIQSSGVADIGPVAALTGLDSLDLKNNVIENIEPLAFGEIWIVQYQ